MFKAQLAQCMPKMATWDDHVKPASALNAPGTSAWRPNKGHWRGSSSKLSAACAGDPSTLGVLVALAGASNDGESHNMGEFLGQAPTGLLTWINTAVNQVHKLHLSSPIQGPAC